MTKSDKASDKTEELKTCPFCGSGKLETYKADEEMYAVYCDGCNASGPAYSDPDSTQPHEAIELWNTRHSPVTPEDARQALDAINSAMKKTINPSGGPKAIDDYCSRQFCCFAALSTNIETIRRALKELI